MCRKTRVSRIADVVLFFQFGNNTEVLWRKKWERFFGRKLITIFGGGKSESLTFVRPRLGKNYTPMSEKSVSCYDGSLMKDPA